MALTPFWTSAPVSFVMPEVGESGGQSQSEAKVSRKEEEPASSSNEFKLHHSPAARHPSSASCPSEAAATERSHLDKSAATYPGT